jgi:Transglutaminase-like superfamily/TgpA N-terminal domain
MKDENLTPPEDSSEVRIACLAMSLLSVSIAYYNLHESILIMSLCFTTIFVGSYLSYKYRSQKNKWLVSFIVSVTVAIMANFVYEIFFQYRMGRLNLIVPFIAALAQLQSLHSADLRTRTDTNTSLLIGLTLLGSTAILSQNILVVITLLLYICLAAFVLYRQSVAFTFDAANYSKDVTLATAPVQLSSRTLKQHRRTVGSTLFTIALLPACSILFSLTIPHLESSIDKFSAALSKSLLPPVLKPGGQSNVASLATRRLPQSEKKSNRSVPKRQDALSHDKKQSEAGGHPTALAGLKNKKPGAGSPKQGKNIAVKSDKKGKPAKSIKENPSSSSKLEQAAKNKTADKNTRHRSLDGSKKEDELSLLSSGKKEFTEDNELLLTMEVSRSVFLKRLAFDHFDGTNWYSDDKPTSHTLETNAEYLTSLNSCEMSKSAAGSIAIKQEITAVAKLGHYIPVVWRPNQIAFPADKIYIDETDNLKTKTLITPGLSYKVVSDLPIYDLPALRSHFDENSEMLIARQLYQDDLELPDELSEKAARLAKTIVGDETRWFAQAELICKYLRTHFKYSITSLDKADKRPIDDFLYVSKTGDCTRFASAFALLCRSLKIPTRCVGGFAPGLPNLATGLIEVRAKQSHAWAEIFLPETGWVPFDAVPGGYLPDCKPNDNLMNQIAKNEFDKQMSNLNALAKPLSDKISSNSPFNWPNSKFDPAKQLGVWCNSQGKLPIAIAFAVFGVLLLYLVGKMYLAGRQRAKFRDSTILFLEVMDSLSRIKIKRSTGDTPQEIMNKVQSRMVEMGKPKWQNDLPELLSSFLDSYCLSRFNATDSPQLTSELKEKSAQIQKLLASAR